MRNAGSRIGVEGRQIVAAQFLVIVKAGQADEDAGGRTGKQSGAIPAFSSASHATSSSSRCCGSMFWASRGAMPNIAGSNPSIRDRKPPLREASLPGASGSGSNNASTSQRSAGVSTTASPPVRSRSQNSSGVSAPPGKRQAMPTIAIGSRAALPAPRRAASTGWQAAPAASANNQRSV